MLTTTNYRNRFLKRRFRFAISEFFIIQFLSFVIETLLEVNYEPAKPSKSLYGFSKGRSVEDSLKEIRYYFINRFVYHKCPWRNWIENFREEKAAIKAAKSERLRREWIGTAPKAALGAPSEKDACLYSINDYLGDNFKWALLLKWSWS